MKTENKMWKLLAPVVVLVAICLVVTTALAFTNAATAPVIAAAEAAKADQAKQVVLPSGSDFQKLEDLTGLPENVTEVSVAGNGAGYVVSVKTKGFGGDMSVMVGVGADGKIGGTQVITHNETEGIGSKVVANDSAFQQQIVGLSDSAAIESVSGATVSSKAMVNAVQTALDACVILGGGTVEVKVAPKPAALTSAVMEQYFPGVAFTEVEGGQVSDAGTIVYGEAQGMESVVGVAVFFDPSGAVLGVVADTLDETEYIGDVVGQNEDFMNSFKGVTDVDAIDAVAQATITSTAVKDAVKQAMANLELVKGAA